MDEESVNINQLEKFLNVFKKVFDIHAPIKKSYIRVNQGPFMNKALQKAVMTNSRPCNKFLKIKTQPNETVYKKQRNYCVSLFRKEKKSFFENLETKNITGNKIFWKTVKPSQANKISNNHNKIALTQKDEIISRSKDVVEMFNTFFVNAVSNLDIVINESLLVNSVETNDPIVHIIDRYKTHPNIRLIKEHATQLDNRFSFEQITYEDTHKQIRKLDCTKASQGTDIPSNIIKENADIFANFLYFNYNKAASDYEFPTSFKNANVSPIYKKHSRLEEKNCRPNCLPNLSKIYERIILSQISAYFDNILSKYQFGFRQGYSLQQCLLVLIDKWEKSLGKEGKCGALLAESPKAFDCLLYNLLIAKLHAYDFEIGKK